MTDMLYCDSENAEKFLDWIRTRGGIAVWRSHNLSNPGASWSTPALTEGAPTAKPTWEAGNSRERVVTDPSQVLVTWMRELKRFHVAINWSGLCAKLTEASSARLRRAVAKAGEGAYYVFDHHGDYKNAVIMVPYFSCTLQAWSEGERPPQAGA